MSPTRAWCSTPCCSSTATPLSPSRVSAQRGDSGGNATQNHSGGVGEVAMVALAPKASQEGWGRWPWWHCPQSHPGVSVPYPCCPMDPQGCPAVTSPQCLSPSTGQGRCLRILWPSMGCSKFQDRHPVLQESINTFSLCHIPPPLTALPKLIRTRPRGIN